MEDLISKLVEMGILASPEALSILSQQGEPLDIVRDVLEGRGELLFLEEEHILEAMALRTQSIAGIDVEFVTHDLSDVTLIHDQKAIAGEEAIAKEDVKNDHIGETSEEEIRNEVRVEVVEERKGDARKIEGKDDQKDIMREEPVVVAKEEVHDDLEGTIREARVIINEGHGEEKHPTGPPKPNPSILHQPPNKARGSLPTYRPIAAEYEEDIEILGDISGKSECQGKIGDFTRYFDNRFNRLKQLIKTRPEMMHALPIEKVFGKSGEISTIGIVTDVNPIEKGIIIEIEDDDESISIFIRKDDRLLKEIGTIVNDEIIGVIGKVNRGRNNWRPSIYPKKILRPPLPIQHNPSFADVELSVAFVSDLHSGSNTFLKKEWKRAIDFLNGKHHQLREEASRIKYLVFPGDIVDGSGIYPDQDKDLEITDIYRQYEAVADDLNSLPEHIKVILLPGNHDAVRKAEPQPALPDDVKKIFDEKRVLFTGNPIWLRLHDVNFLTYHGGSMDDLIPAIPGLSYNNPIAAMKEMMIRRHLAPIYGGKTPLAPEKLDYMIMDEIPDVFVTGHVHTTELARFHNVLLLNASTWMDQTAYQKMRDFVPDPAKLPVIRLDTLKPALINFRTDQNN